MLHPLFSTLIQHPHLALDHVSAYSALISQEAKTAAAHVVKRAVAWVVAGLCAVLCVVFTGVALMLGFLQNEFHWILVAVPGVVLLMTVFALVKANQSLPADNFPELKAQIENDARALRTAN